MSSDNATDRITNAEFARTDGHFQRCCADAGVDPTSRQASKFRNQKGIAYKTNQLRVENSWSVLYQKNNRDQLRKLAADLEIEGRGSMGKEALAKAIANKRAVQR